MTTAAQPISLVVDPVSENVYWTELYTGKICRWNLNGINKACILQDDNIYAITLDYRNRCISDYLCNSLLWLKIKQKQPCLTEQLQILYLHKKASHCVDLYGTINTFYVEFHIYKIAKSVYIEQGVRYVEYEMLIKTIKGISVLFKIFFKRTIHQFKFLTWHISNTP